MMLIHGGSESQDENEEEPEKLNVREGRDSLGRSGVRQRPSSPLRTLPKLGHVPTLSPPSGGTLDLSISLSRP